MSLPVAGIIDAIVINSSTEITIVFHDTGSTPPPTSYEIIESSLGLMATVDNESPVTITYDFELGVKYSFTLVVYSDDGVSSPSMSVMVIPNFEEVA
jgi:hypothetical protein